ncbi:MAG TPA: Spo0B domain-containing protein, partial [Bacillota bacterium]|nr:Spo0B domain-containing protein [Bacillota bacterium]
MTQKLLTTAMVLAALQIGVLLWFVIDTVFVMQSLVRWEFAVFSGIILLLVFVNCYITVRDVKLLEWVEQQNRDMRQNVEHQEKLNHTLRAQRHDFLNHLQVVYSLIEMDEYLEAKEYINHTYQDIQKVGGILKTKIPAVNALLQAKIFAAEQRNIQVELTVTSQLEDLPL